MSIAGLTPEEETQFKAWQAYVGRWYSDPVGAAEDDIQAPGPQSEYLELVDKVRAARGVPVAGS